MKFSLQNCHCLMLIFHFGCITNDLNKTKEKNNGEEKSYPAKRL